jgi:hypothetical protein
MISFTLDELRLYSRDGLIRLAKYIGKSYPKSMSKEALVLALYNELKYNDTENALTDGNAFRSVRVQRIYKGE